MKAIDDSTYHDKVKRTPFLSDSSKTTYRTHMNRILRMYIIAGANSSSKFAVHELLTHPDIHGPSIVNDGGLELNMKKSSLTTVLAYLKYSLSSRDDLASAWAVYYKRVNDDVRELELSNEGTLRQQRNMIEWNDVLKVRERLAKDAYNSDDHLILAMYTYLAPRRQADYACMRVYLQPTDVPTVWTSRSEKKPAAAHNHIHLGSAKYESPYIYICDSKSSKFMDPYFSKEIPTELIKLIRLRVSSRRISPSTSPPPASYPVYMFVTEMTTPFCNVNSFTKFCNRALKRIFDNEEMSLNVLRHSFATYASQLPNLTMRQRTAIATSMGHSVTKSLEYVLLPKDSKSKSKVQDKQTICYKKTGDKVEAIACPS